MRKIVFLLLFLSTQIFSQSNLDDFFKLSGSKKTWVLLHPFKAKKSLEISNETNRVADSIKKTSLLDGD